MALKLKYTDEHGILHINMSPTSTPPRLEKPQLEKSESTEITDPKFDTINHRFGQYDLFGGKYDVEIGGESQTPRSLFRSRYNSIEEELANTPYAFATERSLRLNSAVDNPLVDITIKSRLDTSPSQDIEDDRFFNRNELFGPQIDFQLKTSDEEDSPAFTVTQLIHAQDRYFDLSSRQSSVFDSPKTTVTDLKVRSEPSSAKKERTVRIVSGVKGSEDEAFKVLSDAVVKETSPAPAPAPKSPVVPISKRKKESSFAILAETPAASRPSSPRSLPVEIRPGRVSPFKGRGFREETSRHTTPRTSAANSRASSPPRRRTNSLSRIDKMATATLPPPIQPILNLSRPHSPRNFLKENIEEVRELSELNREKHEAEAEQKRLEEEEALLIEMGLLDKNAKSDAIRSVVCSRTTSRSNSPSKIKLRSRSNSPSAMLPSAILHFEKIPSKEFINEDDGMAKPVTHRSRVRSVSRSQPQSNDGSPKHSKIPKRQSSVSPTRNNRRDGSNSRKPVESNLNRNQRFISNSTSSINETIRVGGQAHDKRSMSKSTQLLNIAPAHIRGKPPISPGRATGPPPSNKSINSKRLSPIVGTPSKSPIEDPKPSSAKAPTKTVTAPKKPFKTAGNTPATSRLNSRQPSRNISRDPSPEKRKPLAKTTISRTPSNANAKGKPVARSVSTRAPTKPVIPKTDVKKPINRTNSMKTLSRTPSTKTLYEKPPLLKKRDSKQDLKNQSMNKIDEVGSKNDSNKDEKKSPRKVGKDEPDKSPKVEKKDTKVDVKETIDVVPTVTKQDNETQYDKITNDKGELVIMTKKNIVSMTTAAITSQPLEVLTTVSNQLPAAFEKAREKGIFERNSSKDSLAPKEDEKEQIKVDTKEINKDKIDEEKIDDKKAAKSTKSTIFVEDNVKLKPLLPPYNNPQVERVKQRIDDILKSPEVSSENIIAATTKVKETTKSTFKKIADKTKTDIKEAKDEVATKLTDIKDAVVKQKEKTTEEIRSEASKIVDSIITPVEEPKEVKEKLKEEVKKDIEPIVMVVNEKKNVPDKNEVVEKINETLVKGEPEVEVQSSNVSTPGVARIEVQNKMADGNVSDKSAQSNGGFPQSTSTTPKPPARAHRKEQSKEDPKHSKPDDSKETTPENEPPKKKPNICQRLMGKCKSKCCPCCIKAEDDENATQDVEAPVEGKTGMSKWNCCKKKKGDDEEAVRDMERAAGKAASIEFESETKRKRKLRDIMCGCCGSKRRVSDVSTRHHDVMAAVGDVTAPEVVGDTGCCGKRKPEVERRDSILSDRPPASCCNNRLFRWMRGACRRHHSEQASVSRRQSMFSKNKSMSPTLPPENKVKKRVRKHKHLTSKIPEPKTIDPYTMSNMLTVTPIPSPQPSRKLGASPHPSRRNTMKISTDLMKRDIDVEEDAEDTRTKLDASLVEHTSVMRGAIPVLPIALAIICLFCNVVVPGLGTIFSGMFCLCFGIPRFGVHDGAKHRIGSFVINLVVGCGQLFTVLFCLVGWGWSIWWGVIMVKISRKYRKLKAEAAAEEAEAAPPVTANNHARA